jgi:hypothetical protein
MKIFFELFQFTGESLITVTFLMIVVHATDHDHTEKRDMVQCFHFVFDFENGVYKCMTAKVYVTPISSK